MSPGTAGDAGPGSSSGPSLVRRPGSGNVAVEPADAFQVVGAQEDSAVRNVRVPVLASR
jgi:hypothetical protein